MFFRLLTFLPMLNKFFLTCKSPQRHSRVNGDLIDSRVDRDIPTIPLTVYQQLKVRYIYPTAT